MEPSLSPSPGKSRVRFPLPLILLIIIAVAGLVWWYLGAPGMNTSEDTPGVKVETVMYTPEGFSPAEVTIQKGTTITFIDRDGLGMWVASNDHPEHAGYLGLGKEVHCPDASGIAFDQCAKVIQYSFRFQKAGEWGYHNHVHPEATGVIIVTE